MTESSGNSQSSDRRVPAVLCVIHILARIRVILELSNAVSLSLGALDSHPVPGRLHIHPTKGLSSAGNAISHASTLFRLAVFIACSAFLIRACLEVKECPTITNVAGNIGGSHDRDSAGRHYIARGQRDRS